MELRRAKANLRRQVFEARPLTVLETGGDLGDQDVSPTEVCETGRGH